MRLLCDENVRDALRNALAQEGHTVSTVREELEEGYDDDEILTYASENRWVILTNDDDFAGAVDHTGVLFYSQQSVEPQEVVEAVRNVELVFDSLDGQVLFVPDGWV